MEERLDARQRDHSLAGWTISVTVALMVFYGTSIFMNSHQQAGSRSAPSVIMHSTPIGGEVEDGVFHSSPPENDDLNISRWQI